MTQAFQGDPAVKAALLATIDRHVQADTLRFGATMLDAVGGTPLAVATGGAEVEAYAKAYGYPLALAALLDPLATMIGERARAVHFVREWIARVEPGVDLAPVPPAIVLDLLDAPETRGLAPPLVEPLVALHRRERSGDIVARTEWAACRRAILAAADLQQPGRMRGLLDLCEAACWSSRSSRSILVTMATKWCDLGEFVADPMWQDEDRAQARSMLHALWRAHGDEARSVNIPALFAAQAPDLARRFEANLVRVNAHRTTRIKQLAALVLLHLGSGTQSATGW